MPERTPEETALEFVRRINDRDLAGVVEMMTDDHVFADSGGAIQRGRDVMRAGWQSYLTSFPAYRIRVERVLRGGDDVALVGSVSGSHAGADAERDQVVAWAVAVRGEQVAGWRVYVDDPKLRALAARRRKSD